MNKDYVLFHLTEAAEELARTIKELETDKAYSEGEFIVAIGHLYHHLNTAWNARDASEERASASSDEDFAKWRQFPKDLDMST